MEHIPVLLKEVIDLLNPQPNENFIDCTCGFAGHSRAILERSIPDGRVLGIEQDSQVYRQIEKENIERLILKNDSYANLKEIVEEDNFGPVNGILLDLGMSSWDIEESGRGFSFQRDEALDMRYGQTQDLTAEEIINRWSEEEIEKVLRDYGEERSAKRIARAITEQRNRGAIKTTFQLNGVIESSLPQRFTGQTSVKARVYQALRIAVNDELGNLEKVLPQAVEVMAKGGCLVVISFHSLEDRIVKNFFKEKKQKDIIKILTKKPVIAGMAEVAVNPRARSAKLRAALKL